MTDQSRLPLMVSLPPRKDIGFAFTLPNLLLSTLFVAALPLPPGHQAFASAPIVKTQTTSCEQKEGSPLTLGIPVATTIPLPLDAQHLSASAPWVKFQVQCFQSGSPHTLGIPLPPASGIPRLPLLLGSPQRAAAGLVDVYPNLLVSTLSAVAVIPAWNDGGDAAPQGKFQAFAEQHNNVLPLAAPPAPLLPALATQLFTNLPQQKYEVTFNPPQRPLTLGIYVVPPPPVIAEYFPAPIYFKYPIQVDKYPNLLESTLYTGPVSATLGGQNIAFVVGAIIPSALASQNIALSIGRITVTNTGAPVASFPPTVSSWTADSAVVTFDSIDFTCDGADLINGGGTSIPNSGNLSTNINVPILPSGLYKGGT